ncbi:MAG TPA: PEP-CTERM sorting domain-containing protein [Gemmataceae bacterium]|nr:PEP-CTERM sorting domain-containing protein [Gemmataceae bacterium]
MKHWVCGFVLAIILLATAEAKADTPLGYVDSGMANLALIVTRDIPEPNSVLLLAAGLISLALLATIGRPPFRLKF